MKKLLELISDDNGRLSRTQSTIVFWFLYTAVLLVLEILKGGIFSIPVGATLAGVFVFAFIDRINVNHIYFKLSQTGMELTATEKMDEVTKDKK